MKKLLVFLLLLLLLMFAACSGGVNSSKNENARAEPTQMAVIQWLYPLPSYASVSGLLAAENVCMVAGETDTAIYVTVMPFSVVANTLSFSDTISFKYEGRNHVYGVATDEKSFFLLAGNKEDGQYSKEASELIILTVSLSGELVGETSLSGGLSVEPQGFCISGDSFIIGGNDSLSFFERDGNLKSIIKTDYEIWALQSTYSGAVVQLNKNDSFPLFFVEESETLVPVDWDDTWLSFSRWDINGKLICGTDIFCEYDLNTGEKRELLNWLELTGDIYRYNNFCRIAEEYYLYSGNDSTIYFMTTEYKVDSRKLVRIAYLDDNSQQNARAMAAKFNLCSKEYRAEATLYDDKQKMEMALSVGDCPDIVLFSWGNLDTTTNQFLDLIPLLDKSDVISQDSFLPGLLDGLAIGNELHEIWYATAIHYWKGQSKYIDSFNCGSWDDYRETAENLGDRYTIVDQELNKNVLMEQFMQSEIHNYVDLDDWSCRFNSPGFAELLKICKNVGCDYSPIYDSDDRGAEYEAYMANYIERLPLIKFSLISNCHGKFPNNTKLIRSPFSSTYASYDEAIMGAKLCVPARSANLDGALAFMEYILCPETQIHNCLENAYLYGIPTSKGALEYCLESIMEPVDAKQLRAIMAAKPQVINAVKLHLIDLVSETVQAYFAGDKSLDETLSLVQSKASLYLAEKKPFA